MKNYLEFKIPVQRNVQWYKELCEAMQEVRIPVRWQNGFYHITVAFMHDDLHVKELRETFARILSGKKAPSITLDKLEVFHLFSFRLLKFPSRKPSTVISEPIQSTIGNSLNSFSIGGQTTEKCSEKGAMNDLNVQFLFGNMADFVQMYKIICICQLIFVPLQPILKLLL